MFRLMLFLFPDDVVCHVADFLWFECSSAMVDVCHQWRHLVSGRYLIRMSMPTGSVDVSWPPKGLFQSREGSVWIDLSIPSNKPLLVPSQLPPLGQLLQSARQADFPDFIVISYSNTLPPHPVALASVLRMWKWKNGSPASGSLIVQARGRSLVVIATGIEVPVWLRHVDIPFLCGPRRLHCYVCVPPVTRWISLENYNMWFNWDSMPAVALAVDVHRSGSIDPWMAFGIAKSHWQQHQHHLHTMNTTHNHPLNNLATHRLTLAITLICRNT